MRLHRYLLFICGVLIASRAVLGEEVKKAVGDQVSFKPDKMVPPVTSITWKHVKPGTLTVKAIEWEDGEITIPNQRFTGITNLNKETGEITITKLRVEHTGVYTIDISGKEQTQRFTLTVIDPVLKPVIEVEKIPDNPDVVYLSCKYNENVIWSNSAGEDLAIHSNGKSITVKKNEGNPENSYTCTLKNAVSEKTSDPVYKKDLFNDESAGGPWWLIIVIPLLLILIFGIFLAVYKLNQKFRELVDDKCPCIEGCLDAIRCPCTNHYQVPSGQGTQNESQASGEKNHEEVITLTGQTEQN